MRYASRRKIDDRALRDDRARRIAVAGLAITAGIYLCWRATVFNPQQPAFSWFAYACELIGFARTLLFLRSTLHVPPRAAPSAPAGLPVDVAVTTLDESLDLVRSTLAAAAAIRYPHVTWLLDDGARAEMRDLAAELGCRYISRTDRTHDKAGNLNHGIVQMRGAFLALFDADHVADPRFLDRTLGYFEDARVAFVQTPHEYRNTDAFDFLRRDAPMHAQSLFNNVIQPARNDGNASQYCSSAGVVRRAALDAIGGFATGTVNEDTHTSLRINAAGFHGIFHAEVLALCLAPFDAAAYYGQRQRFAHGAVQILMNEPLLWRRGLSPAQRKTFFFHVVANIEGWRFATIYALPIAILTTGILPVRASGTAFLSFFVPYAALAWIATDAFSRGHARVFQTAVYNLARVPASIRGTLTGRRLGRTFRVTPKARRARVRSREEAFPWVVAVASLAALGSALARSAIGSPPLAPDALAIVGAWAAYHAAVAIRLIVLTRRCR